MFISISRTLLLLATTVLVTAASLSAKVVDKEPLHIDKQVVQISQPISGLEDKLPQLQEEKQPIAIVATSRGEPLRANSSSQGSHRDWLAAAGIAESAYEAVESIVSRESHWDPFSWNYSGSGAYGVCQSLPASKMASAGDDYMTNPVTQLKWCNQYCIARYGDWQNAKLFWDKHGWW